MSTSLQRRNALRRRLVSQQKRAATDYLARELGYGTGQELVEAMDREDEERRRRTEELKVDLEDSDSDSGGENEDEVGALDSDGNLELNDEDSDDDDEEEEEEEEEEQQHREADRNAVEKEKGEGKDEANQEEQEQEAARPPEDDTHSDSLLPSPGDPLAAGAPVENKTHTGSRSPADTRTAEAERRAARPTTVATEGGAAEADEENTVADHDGGEKAQSQTATGATETTGQPMEEDEEKEERQKEGSQENAGDKTDGDSDIDDDSDSGGDGQEADKPSGGAAGYLQMLKAEEEQIKQQKKRKGGLNLLETEAEEEEEDEAQPGLGDFGFGVPSTKDGDKEEDERVTIEKEDLDAIVDHVDENEGNEEDAAKFMKEQHEAAEKEGLKRMVDLVRTGQYNQRRRTDGRGLFSINDLTSADNRDEARRLGLLTEQELDEEDERAANGEGGAGAEELDEEALLQQAIQERVAAQRREGEAFLDGMDLEDDDDSEEEAEDEQALQNLDAEKRRAVEEERSARRKERMFKRRANMRKLFKRLEREQKVRALVPGSAAAVVAATGATKTVQGRRGVGVQGASSSSSAAPSSSSSSSSSSSAVTTLVAASATTASAAGGRRRPHSRNGRTLADAANIPVHSAQSSAFGNSALDADSQFGGLMDPTGGNSVSQWAFDSRMDPLDDSSQLVLSLIDKRNCATMVRRQQSWDGRLDGHSATGAGMGMAVPLSGPPAPARRAATTSNPASRTVSRGPSPSLFAQAVHGASSTTSAGPTASTATAAAAAAVAAAAAPSSALSASGPNGTANALKRTRPHSADGVVPAAASSAAGGGVSAEDAGVSTAKKRHRRQRVPRTKRAASAQKKAGAGAAGVGPPAAAFRAVAPPTGGGASAALHRQGSFCHIVQRQANTGNSNHGFQTAVTNENRSNSVPTVPSGVAGAGGAGSMGGVWHWAASGNASSSSSSSSSSQPF